MRMIGNILPRDEEVSLYFHIPFCTRKCDYCHFYVLPDKEPFKQQLAEGFQLEWALLKPFLTGKKIVTLYFGGGTPFLFGPERLNALIQLIRNSCEIKPHAEITLEANPENMTLELMQAYAEAGVNRVSIGVQTLDPKLLNLLGRLHNPETALKAVELTHRAGIGNISIDLMYDLPHQSLVHWQSTLKQIQTLPIQHLSLYNLTIEPHTIFFKKQAQLQPVIPDQETSLAMYEMAVEYFEKAGLRRYEISAFAKPGFESQHNTGYWIGRPFLGLGPSAFSYWEGKRFRNIANLSRYCQMLEKGQFPRDFEEMLELDAHRRELFVIHLRLREGVNLAKFEDQYGILDVNTHVGMKNLIEQRYLQMQQGCVQLTHKGILFYDSVAAELI